MTASEAHDGKNTMMTNYKWNGGKDRWCCLTCRQSGIPNYFVPKGDVVDHALMHVLLGDPNAQETARYVKRIINQPK